ncbi:MAG: hypothetical protein JOZ87_29695 [Chloroflexi bacterium]|nr:hypothetical protein [Chloroflexota bacterium]
MAEAQSPDSLDAHVDQAVRTITAVVAATTLELQPMLHLVGPSGAVSVAVLAATRGGQDIARGARWLVNEQQPRHAILLSESWAVRPGLPARDPHMAAVLAGHLRPSQLPPAKRSELLVLYAESRDGLVRQRGYPIERTPSGHRRLVPQDWFAGRSKSVESRFRPPSVIGLPPCAACGHQRARPCLPG